MSPFSQNRGTHLEAAATHLAHGHLVRVFACSGAICGEDGCTVAIGVPVDRAHPPERLSREPPTQARRPLERSASSQAGKCSFRVDLNSSQLRI